MAGFYGGDTGQMRTQATACTQGAQQISDLAAALNGVINGVTWVGPDADAFRELWSGTVHANLISRAEAIRTSASELDGHAQEQDRTSSTDGFGGAAGAGVGAGAGAGSGTGAGAAAGAGVGNPFHGVGQSLGDGGADTAREGLGGSGSDEQPIGDTDYIPGQETYRYGASDDYGDVSSRTGDDRPLGPNAEQAATPWEGEEGLWGHIDASAQGSNSGGAHVTTDQHGNVTASAGGRASANAEFDASLHGPLGESVEVSADIGGAVYAEIGGTAGPDGLSAGAAVGWGAYAEGEAAYTVHGLETSVKGEAMIGAEAHANAHLGLTRTEEGRLNGFAAGFDAGAFAGAEAETTYKLEAPGGWFSAETKVGVNAGAGAEASAGFEISTDEISFQLGGALAPGAGGSAAGQISFRPNDFVNAFTPGDYDLDDAIDDVGGFFKSINPFD